MSVQNQTVKNVYAGNGSATVFPYTFALLESDGEHVGVYITNDVGVSEKTTNFTIDTAAKTVTYPAAGDPLESGKKITIKREIPNEQELNLENLGPFFANDVEGEMDREVMMIQQLAEAISRAITTDMASDETPEEFKDRLLASSEAAAASAAAAAISETNAHDSELAAKASEENAALSEEAADGSASDAANSATLAQKWAGSPTSPDGEVDADSDTGYTKSSKSWALEAKADAQYADEVATTLEGIAEPLAWDENETYNYPDIVAYTDGYTYRCVGTNVTGEDVPGQSIQWVSLMYGIGAWQLDANQDLMPAAAMVGDDDWEYDEQGNLMPMP